MTKALSDIKAKVKYAFKGMDAKELSNSMKEVNADIKRTEAEARKAKAALSSLLAGKVDTTELKQASSVINDIEKQLRQAKTELDKLLTGQKTPESVQALKQEIKQVDTELGKTMAAYDKLLQKNAKLENTTGGGIKGGSYRQEQIAENNKQLDAYAKKMETLEARYLELDRQLSTVKMNPELTPEAQKYQLQIDKLTAELNKWKELSRSIKQNPQLSEDAERYNQIIKRTTAEIETLKNKQKDLNKEVERNRVINEQSSKSVVAGLGKIEQRITRLAKRVLFFSVITLGLRKFRKLVVAAAKSDSELSASLAQVKGNLATAFGSIWLSVLPALRALINALAIATKYLAAFISWITGKSLKQGQQAYEAMSASSEDTAKNTKKVGKAAKKAAKDAQRLLMPFDQMNVLSKDTQDTTADTSVATPDDSQQGVGITYPTDNIDKITAKFEKFKDLIVLIGMAFAAWKLAPLFSTLFKISKLSAFAGVASLAFGIYLLVTGIQDILKNGPNFENVMRTWAGAILIVGGAALLLGAAWAPIVIGIGLVIFALSQLYKHFKPFREYVDKALKKIKKAFKDKGVLGGFLEIGKQIILGILNGMWWVIKNVGKWIKKKVINPIIKWFKKLLGISSPAKETMPIGEMIIKGMLEGMLAPIKGVGSWIKKKVLDPIKKALFGGNKNKDDNSVKISTKFTDTKDAIKKKWQNLTSDVKDKTAEMKASVKQKWEDIKNKWQGLTGNVKNKTADMKARVKQKWNSIKTAWTDLTKNVKEKVADMKAQVKQKWESIKAAWNNLTKNVKSKTADMKAKVKTKWSDLKTTWNNLMANFKDKTANVKLKIGTTVQSAKDFVNNIIYKLNSKLGNLKWPSWVPGIGGDWVFSSADPIPYLAQGAVIPPNKQFLAMLGDQKHGTNIETPLSTMIDAFNTALAQNGMGGATEVNVYLQGDAKQLFKVVRTEANNHTRSTGKAAFEL